MLPDLLRMLPGLLLAALDLRSVLRRVLLDLQRNLRLVLLLGAMMLLVPRLRLCRCWELVLVRLLLCLGCCRCKCQDERGEEVKKSEYDVGRRGRQIRTFPVAGNDQHAPLNDLTISI
jgi:hypothetical protein